MNSFYTVGVIYYPYHTAADPSRTFAHSTKSSMVDGQAADGLNLSEGVFNYVLTVMGLTFHIILLKFGVHSTHEFCKLNVDVSMVRLGMMSACEDD